MQAPPASQPPIHRGKRERGLERMEYTWAKSSYGAGQRTSMYIVICLLGTVTNIFQFANGPEHMLFSGLQGLL